MNDPNYPTKPPTRASTTSAANRAHVTGQHTPGLQARRARDLPSPSDVIRHHTALHLLRHASPAAEDASPAAVGKVFLDAMRTP